MSELDTPRLVIDPKRQFVKRKIAALELQREEFRVTRRMSTMQRQLTDMQAQAERAGEDAKRAEAEAATLTEAEAQAHKRAEADKARALADKVWDTVDTLMGELEELSGIGAGMITKKAGLIGQFVDWIAYDDADGHETRRTARPSNVERGADDSAFQTLVDELVGEADEDQFNELLAAFTGTGGKAPSPPTSDAK